MKPLNHPLFDDLMRQKLETYSDEPPMELLEAIHIRKNRLMNVYRLANTIGLLILGTASLMLPFVYVFYSSHQHEVAVSNPSLMNQASKNVEMKSSDYPFSAYAFVSFSDKKDESIDDTEIDQYNSIGNKASNSTMNHLKISEQDKLHHFSASKTSNLQSEKTTPNVHQVIYDAVSKQYDLADLAETTSNKKEQKEQDEEKKVEQEKVVEKCAAKFDYYVSYDGKVQFTNFSDYASGSKIKWDFGDGQNSESDAPAHVYKKQGNYLATLYIQSGQCQSSFQKYIYLQSSERIAPSRFEGRVVMSSNDYSQMTVELIKISSNNRLEISQRVRPTQSGAFSFEITETGEYTILANTNSAEFSPTYWGNVTAYIDATKFNIASANDGFSGIIIQLASKENTSVTSTKEARFFDSTVLVLLDANNRPVENSKVVRNADGSYRIEGAGNGSYKILNTQTGSISSDVTLNNNNSGSKSSSGESVSDRELTWNTPSSSLVFSPNPASSSCNFSVESGVENEQVEITIINSMGQTVKHEIRNSNLGPSILSVDITGLNAGTYYVIIRQGNKKPVTGSLFKTLSGSGINGE
jgi:hypothetical protein